MDVKKQFEARLFLRQAELAELQKLADEKPLEYYELMRAVINDAVKLGLDGIWAKTRNGQRLLMSNDKSGHIIRERYSRTSKSAVVVNHLQNIALVVAIGVFLLICALYFFGCSDSCRRCDLVDGGIDAVSDTSSETADASSDTDNDGGIADTDTDTDNDGGIADTDTDTDNDGGIADTDTENDGGLCGGVFFEGVCWYLGDMGADCWATCAAHGALYDAATADIAGSGGTTEACRAVLDALSLAGFETSEGEVKASPCGAGLGCIYTPGDPGLGPRARCYEPPTSADSEHDNSARVCACLVQ